MLEPGFYPDLPPADYFADPCPRPSLTQSIAKILIERSPAHAKAAHPRLAPDPEPDDDPEKEKYNAAAAIGNAAHSMLLGKSRELMIGDFPSWQSKDAKAFKAEHEAAGRLIILKKHNKIALRIVSEARRQLKEAGMAEAFLIGEGEVCIVSEEDGHWQRSLVDWMVDPRNFYDLKTTGTSVAPQTIPHRGATDGWDVQAAMQERILDALDPRNRGRRRFRFVAIENEPPFALQIVELSEAWLTMGRKKLEAAIRIWRHCLDRDEWPAYGPEILLPQYPGYLENRWLEREIDGVGPAAARMPAGDVDLGNILRGG